MNGAPVAPGVDAIELSIDPHNGADSRRLRIAAGTRLELAGAGVDAEIYMLNGQLQIGAESLHEDNYVYRAGTENALIATALDESELLVFREPASDSSLDIEIIDAKRTAWGAASDPKVASAAIRRLVLRPDTPSGDRTWLLRLETDDAYALNGIERHPCVEEMYLLDGDIHMHTGVLTTGAYFWRPPEIAHGPMGSTSGFTALFRAKEGRFITEWTESDGTIPWNTPYQPILPTR